MAVSKVYNGTAWVDGIIKTWNGTAWEDKPAYYDGADWVELYPAGGADVVTLSGEVFISGTDATAPYDARAGIRVNTDGTIDKYSYNGSTLTLTQVDASTDWIIPNGSAPSDYQFKLDVTSNAPNYSSDSTATWIAVTGGSVSASYLQWVFQRTTVGSTSWNWTLRVRKGTGAEIDNAVYTGNTDAGI